MTNWLLHPALQAGVLPFIASLVIAITLFKKSPSFSGAAPILTFFLSVMIIYGSADVPSPWIRKFVAGSIIVFFLGALLDRVEMRANVLRSILFCSGIAVAGWVFAPDLRGMMDRNPSNTLLVAILVTFYPAWLTWGLGEMSSRPLAVYTAVALLGVGTGVAAVFANAELVAELALALGVAAGAGVYLVAVARWSVPAGLTLAMPAGIILGLLGATAFFYATLSPVSLVACSLVPFVLMVQPPEAMTTIRGYWLWTIMLLCIVVVAVFLAYVGSIRGYI